MERFFKKKLIFAIMFFVLLLGLNIYSIGQYYGVFESGDLEAKALTIYGNIGKILGKRESNNLKYVKDEDGYIYYSAEYIQADNNILGYATRVRRLKEYVQEKGSKFMVVSFPQKNWEKTQAGVGLSIANYNFIQDEFLFNLMYGHIDTLDIRNIFNEMQIDKGSLYYKTDRSLTSYGSFSAFIALLGELESRYDLRLDPDYYYRNLENYKKIEYKKCFLGNLGDDTGMGFAELEDFNLYVLHDKNRYIWEYTNKKNTKLSKDGVGEQTLLDMECINFEDVYNSDFMDVYMNTDNPLDVVKNLDNKHGIRVLCIKDEQFAPLAVFLSPMCSEIHLISANSNLVDIDDYVLENEFDLVLVEISSRNIKDEYFNYGRTKDSYK